LCCHYNKLGQLDLELVRFKRIVHQQRNMAFNVMTNIYLTIPILTLLLLSLDNWVGNKVLRLVAVVGFD